MGVPGATCRVSRRVRPMAQSSSAGAFVAMPPPRCTPTTSQSSNSSTFAAISARKARRYSVALCESQPTICSRSACPRRSNAKGRASSTIACFFSPMYPAPSHPNDRFTDIVTHSTRQNKRRRPSQQSERTAARTRRGTPEAPRRAIGVLLRGPGPLRRTHRRHNRSSERLRRSCRP